MNDELIKRIDEQMKALNPYDKNGYRSADFDIHALLYDCRAALTKKYVTMTYDEAFYLTDDLTVECEEDRMIGIKFLHEDEFVKYARRIESEVIRRAEIGRMK